jgi:S-adenosylmethionine:tRNA ribosyltransferase-isomerase
MAQGRWDGEVPQWYPYEDAHPNLSLSEAMATVAAYVREHGETKFVASTRIIIAPGYKYRVIKGMVTNFHQPGSTLLLLVSALIGDVWRDIYDYALSHNFRFLSYGDACLFTCS